MKLKTVFIILFLISLAASVNALSNLTQGLNFCADFENNAIDSSGINAIGTLNNSPVYIANCKNGGCFNFNGTNQFLEWADNANLDITGNITINAWVYRNSSNSWDAIVDKWWNAYSYAFPSNQEYLQSVIAGTDAIGASTFATQRWYMVTLIYNGSDIVVYQNATLYRNVTKTGSLTSNTYTLQVGYNHGDTVSYFNGSIDTVSIWNKVLNDSQIEELYNTSNGVPCTNINLSGTAISTPPTVTFRIKNPSDYTFFNIINQNLYSNWTVTDDTEVVNSSIMYFYKTNTSASDCWYSTAGVQTCYWQNTTRDRITFNAKNDYNVSFMLSDNQILPGGYDYNQTEMEISPKTKYSMTGNGYGFITNITMDNTSHVHILELYANYTGAPPNLVCGFCEDAYTSGTWDTSALCTPYFSLNYLTFGYNHSHGTKSWHHVETVLVDRATSKISSTNISIRNNRLKVYCYRTGNANTWELNYINNQSFPNTRTSTDRGLTMSALTGTPDLHTHWNSSSIVYSYACAQDNSGNSNCSAISSDTLDFDPLPPAGLVFYDPTNGTYQGVVNINFSIALSPQSSAIAKYNVSLYAINGSLEQLLNTSATPLTNISFNANSFRNGDYFIRVIACDTANYCSTFNSQDFSLLTVTTPTTLPAGGGGSAGGDSGGATTQPQAPQFACNLGYSGNRTSNYNLANDMTISYKVCNDNQYVSVNYNISVIGEYLKTICAPVEIHKTVAKSSCANLNLYCQVPPEKISGKVLIIREKVENVQAWIASCDNEIVLTINPVTANVTTIWQFLKENWLLFVGITILIILFFYQFNKLMENL